MALVVQKYGGSSLVSPERIREVAARVVRTRHRGDVAVVVSAMGSETDELVRLAGSVSDTQPGREMDMLLSAGERKSTALLTMALVDSGIPAESFSGGQAGILTDPSHQRAEIVEVSADRLRTSIAAGRIPVVAGFQGVSATDEITTLGRGGSDTTAVAVAAALGAGECEICTDVPGVFTADPRVVAGARLLPGLSYDELLELTASGCPKPDMRAVELARRHEVPLHIRSSFTDEPGTRVTPVSPTRAGAVALAHNTSVTKIILRGVPHRPGTAARLFRLLADRRVSVDMIVQNAPRPDGADISFSVSNRDATAAFQACRDQAEELEASDVLSDPDIATVSLIGSGMQAIPGVAAGMFEVLANGGVNIGMISTSPIRVSCAIRQDQVERAVQSLHAALLSG